MQAQYLEEAAQRRALHNELLDLKGAIRVFCRVRPLLAKERTARLQAATTCNLLTNTITVTGNRSDCFYMLSYYALFAACGFVTRLQAAAMTPSLSKGTTSDTPPSAAPASWPV